ncbi:MAG: hypothetical protein JWR69_328 [Pedosphaera sp.]|nr:hypothetical protein [Pedosphaera sp.]
MKTCLRLLVILVAAVCLAGCDKMRQRENFQRDLGAAVKSALATNQPSIQISSLTRFEWDKVYFFHPYTPPDAIDKELGFKWKAGVKTEIESNDGFTLVVFVKKGEVVQYARIRGNLGHWNLDERNGFASGEDVFELERQPSHSEIMFHVKRTNSLPITR